MTEAEYYQAKSVLDSPNDYDGRMVTDARNYVRGYEDAESQLKAKMPSEQEIINEADKRYIDHIPIIGIKRFHYLRGVKWLKQQILKP